MDCRIPREQFIGTETFTGPDGLTYPKVKITSNWNQICLVALDYYSLEDENINGDSYEFTETIDEGEYSYEELFNSIYNIFKMFEQDLKNKNMISIFVDDGNVICHPSLKKLIQVDGLKENINYNYISSDIENYNCFNIETQKYIIVIKQTEYGIDKILPFTIPFRTFTTEILSDRNLSFQKCSKLVSNRDKLYETYYAYIHTTFFNVIWLNENFFETNESKIITVNQYGYNFTNNNDIFIADSGIFSKYGMLMNMMGLTFNPTYVLECIPSYYKNDTNNIIQLFATSADFTMPLEYNKRFQGIELTNFDEINTNNIAISYNNGHYANLYDLASHFEYEANEFDITIGRSFTTTPIIDLQGETTYSISSGTLPTGLTLNTSTGVISGIPTVISNNQVTISAVNDGKMYTFDLIINIVALVERKIIVILM